MKNEKNDECDPFIGREILNGEFRILEKIGTGGMGSVYRANQTAMNWLVAVKILHPKLTNRRDLVSRFRREAKAMSHLTHPNTVKVFMYGELEEDGSLAALGSGDPAHTLVEGPRPRDVSDAEVEHSDSRLHSCRHWELSLPATAPLH